jgi:mono/diheme cytochrome c family protein
MTPAGDVSLAEKIFRACGPVFDARGERTSASLKLGVFEMRTTFTTFLLVAVMSACTRDAVDPRDTSAPPYFPDANVDEVPPDLSDIVQADPPPPAISGGTLLITRDDALAVAADPALDQVFVVDLSTQRLSSTIDLDEGDEPGRLVEDAEGRVHVALRRGGAVVSLDPRAGTLLDRRAVCAAPRGIAHRTTDDTLIVACAEGKLVFLPATGGPPTDVAEPASDLRDVVVLEDGRLMVSRFRSAEILVLSSGEDHGVEQTITLPSTSRVGRGFRVPRPGDERTFGRPEVAWRMVPSGDGALMLHQRATSGVIDIDPSSPGGGYGGRSCDTPSVVQTAATFVHPDGSTNTLGALDGVVLGVDISLAPTGDRFVVAAPGSDLPRGVRSGGGDVVTFSAALPEEPGPVEVPPLFEPPVEAPEETSPTPDPALIEENCVRPWDASSTPGRGAAVAVAYRADGTLVSLVHAPALLVIAGAGSVSLSADDRFDTGQALFHSATGAGIACASCHPEGGDDGQVWFFSDVGLRRTQSFAGALLGTEPFHWSGDMADFDMLAHSVFEDRMGGEELSRSELIGFAMWLDTLQPPPRPLDEDAAAVERGRALFISAEVGCAVCHQGPQLTSSLTVDVGTGEALQVPSLVGVLYRAPYMHDGCAADLRARLVDPSCGGGEMHGHTAHLTDGQVDDLIAFLSTL